MASRIVNLTNGHRYKFNQALRHIDQCNCAWVVYGVSVRTLDVAEKVKARSEQTRKEALTREVLGSAEIHGLRFERPKNTTYQQPWAAYEDMEAPMSYRYCVWPRRAA